MRVWKVELQFKNGTKRFTSFNLAEVAAFIKNVKTEGDTTRLCNTLPIDTWIIHMVFREAFLIHADTELVVAVISKEA